MEKERRMHAVGEPKAGAILGHIYKTSEVLLLKLMASVRKI